MPPVDWSKHRQPNMVPVSWRLYLRILLIEFAIAGVVVAVFGNPRTSLAAALALSLALASLPAGAAAYAIRRRKPPLRFGLMATAVIVTPIWGMFATYLFLRTYQAY